MLKKQVKYRGKTSKIIFYLLIEINLGSNDFGKNFKLTL